jgi:hypothetical protein
MPRRPTGHKHTGHKRTGHRCADWDTNTAAEAFTTTAADRLCYLELSLVHWKLLEAKCQCSMRNVLWAMRGREPTFRGRAESRWIWKEVVESRCHRLGGGV